MLIWIIPVSSESVHLYNRTYFLILVGDSSCDTSNSDDDVTMMVDKVCGESTWENIKRLKVIEIPIWIFHFGTHTCKKKIVKNPPTDLVAAAISVDPKTKPSQIQGKAILTAIQKRKSWNELEKVAKQVTDKRVISNENIKQRQQTLLYGERYEAIREYNLYTDKKDPLLIYSLN